LVKENLREIITGSLRKLKESGFISTDPLPIAQIEIPKDPRHGDFATNIAMILASAEKKNPRQLAEHIVNAITANGNVSEKGFVKSLDLAGPGFINITLSEDFWRGVVRRVLAGGETYGNVDLGQGRRVQIEFVSANPTGPLHVGHARGGVVGDAMANILSAAGYEVQREYYINDAGAQVINLGKSVFARYQELFGRSVVFEDNYYMGDYIKDIAARIKDGQGDRLLGIPEADAVTFCKDSASREVLDQIKKDLSDFGIVFNEWFSEKSLYDEGLVSKYIEEFKERRLIYEKEGALWFDTTDYGDDKDRVVIKSDNEPTYFASDIAYHWDKFHRRGFDIVINVWGADHHGYVVRMKAAVKAMGIKPENLILILVQLVNLVRGGSPVSMSKRAGEFVTIRDVMDEVGKDAMRWFMLMRSYDSHLDFDLDLATKQSQENPVYYVQYAHARICSILRQAEEAGLATVSDPDTIDLSPLKLAEELALMKVLARFPDVIADAAREMEPHRVIFYVFELASEFHSYYNSHRVITEDRALTAARLGLIAAIGIVIRRALTIVGVSAPERM
jgi:arginyl-tRNA synthetase